MLGVVSPSLVPASRHIPRALYKKFRFVRGKKERSESLGGAGFRSSFENTAVRGVPGRIQSSLIPPGFFPLLLSFSMDRIPCFPTALAFLMPGLASSAR